MDEDMVEAIPYFEDADRYVAIVDDHASTTGGVLKETQTGR